MYMCFEWLYIGVEYERSCICVLGVEHERSCICVIGVEYERSCICIYMSVCICV